MKLYFGIDIGGTSVKMGIVDECGHILRFHEASVSFNDYQTPIIETVIKHAHEFINQSCVHFEGIAISATGQIDVKRGVVVGTCGNIPNYIGSNFKERFQEEFHCSVTVVNDANCMILGEKWIGGASSFKDVVGITLGTGVGGGIIINDEILLGSRGLAGEIGHIVVNNKGSRCTCGNNGCFEQLASTSALVRQVKLLYPENLDIDGKWIFNEVNLGNKEVINCLNNWISDIADGIVSLVHIFNPSCILIGGGVSSQESLLIEPLRKLVLSSVMPRFRDNLELRKATLENHAGLVGAVYYFIQNN